MTKTRHAASGRYVAQVTETLPRPRGSMATWINFGLLVLGALSSFAVCAGVYSSINEKIVTLQTQVGYMQQDLGKIETAVGKIFDKLQSHER